MVSETDSAKLSDLLIEIHKRLEDISTSCASDQDNAGEILFIVLNKTFYTNLYYSVVSVKRRTNTYR